MFFWLQLLVCATFFIVGDFLDELFTCGFCWMKLYLVSAAPCSTNMIFIHSGFVVHRANPEYYFELVAQILLLAHAEISELHVLFAGETFTSSRYRSLC